MYIKSIESDASLYTRGTAKLYALIRLAALTRDSVLITACTGFGKTHSIFHFNWSEVLDDQIVVHVSPTREARDKAAEMAESAGHGVRVLRGRFEACGTAEGRYDASYAPVGGHTPSEYLNHLCDSEQMPLGLAHEKTAEVFGALKCEPDCPALRQQAEIDRIIENGDVEFICICAPFLHVRSLTEGNVIILDEFPSYSTPIYQEQLRRAVSELLDRKVKPGMTWEEFIVTVRNGSPGEREEFKNALDAVHDDTFPFAGDDNHRLSLPILKALVRAEEIDNSLLVGKYGEVSVILDAKNTIVSAHHIPDLSTAHVVIGLDAHPSPLRWELATGLKMAIQRVFTPEEELEWRREHRKLTVVQIGNHTRNFTKKKNWTDEARQSTFAWICEIRRRHGDEFRTCTCPKSIEAEVRQLMLDAGISDPEIMTYGTERSRNDFAGETVGLVIGCIDPGDDFVLGSAALLGKEVHPKLVKTSAGWTRATGPGRATYTGPDADAATELLESVRRDTVQQAVGRYARNPRDPENGATVYVFTNVLPAEMVDEVIDANVRQVTPLKESIVEFARDAATWVTVKEVSDALNVDKGHVRETLNDLVNQGSALRMRATGKYGADEYVYLDGDLKPAVDRE